MTAKNQLHWDVSQEATNLPYDKYANVNDYVTREEMKRIVHTMESAKIIIEDHMKTVNAKHTAQDEALKALFNSATLVNDAVVDNNEKIETTQENGVHRYDCLGVSIILLIALAILFTLAALNSLCIINLYSKWRKICL